MSEDINNQLITICYNNDKAREDAMKVLDSEKMNYTRIEYADKRYGLKFFTHLESARVFFDSDFGEFTISLNVRSELYVNSKDIIYLEVE